MLINFFRGGFKSQDFIMLIYFIIIWCITLTIHECAHGYTAYKMGDPTAKNFGRLTINPVKHIDPIGLIMILFIGFGWAKPVPINTRYFRNPRKGMAISAAAGPVSNILMAILGIIIYRFIWLIILKGGFYGFEYGYMSINPVAMNALDFFSYFAMLNVWFAIFNLIPIPPLDGSRIVTYFLPYKWGYYYNYVERYGFLILFIGLWTGILSKPLNFFIEIILNIIIRILNLLPFILL